MFDQRNGFSGQPQQHSPFSEQGFLGGSLSPSLSVNPDVLTAKLEQLLLELDRLIRTSGITTCALLPPNHAICLLMRQIPLLISQSPQPVQSMLDFVEKVVYMLYKSNTTFALEAYTGFLQSLFELSVDVAKEALSWIVYADDERKYNAPVIAMLIRHELLPLEEYDVQLAKAIFSLQKQSKDSADVGRAAEYATELLSVCLLPPSPITFLEDHALTIAALYELVKANKANERMTALIQALENRVNQPYQDIEVKNVNCLELRIQLAEWARLCQHPMAGPQLYREAAKKVMQITKDSDGQCIFFRLCTETCVEHLLSFKALSTSFHRRTVQLIDAFAKLVTYMVRLEESDNNNVEKVAVANRAFSVVILVLSRQHENRKLNFNQKPFLRILSSMFTELNKIESIQLRSGILAAFSDTLYTLQPLNFPGFAFSWLQLLSNRSFMPQMLTLTERGKGWLVYQKLIVALLKFLGPLLEHQVLQKATRHFYRGTLRFLVVLLHDFPEFLCEHYMTFAQVIPHTCVQLRNLVLSAFPRVMHLPDPFTSDLRLDCLPEFKQDPALDFSFMQVLDSDFRKIIDDYVLSPSDSFYTKTKGYICSSEDEGRLKYKADVLGAFVLHIGSMTASKDMDVSDAPATQAYMHLLSEMNLEGRYLLLNAIVDHLRYPNNHTHYFNRVLLHLFATQPESMKEQIIRVLLERLIVNRPHPWGLLATFIDLIKDPGFWDHDFIRCAPDIERLFDNVSRSIKRST